MAGSITRRQIDEGRDVAPTPVKKAVPVTTTPITGTKSSVAVTKSVTTKSSIPISPQSTSGAKTNSTTVKSYSVQSSTQQSSASSKNNVANTGLVGQTSYGNTQGKGNAETAIINSVISVASTTKKAYQILYANAEWEENDPVPVPTPTQNNIRHPTATPTPDRTTHILGTRVQTDTATQAIPATPGMWGQMRAGGRREPALIIGNTAKGTYQDPLIDLLIDVTNFFYNAPKLSDAAGEFGGTLTTVAENIATAALGTLTLTGPNPIAMAIAGGAYTVASVLDNLGNLLILQDIFVDTIEESLGRDTTDPNQVEEMLQEGIVEIACEYATPSWNSYSPALQLALKLFCETF